ncbi:MobF family relaxase [Novosphingobium sp. P6W]|uniref:MobF family relaxase n=1 Tax=Novosphingobium sp. P6W TaxID=1609758 RepID=UPI0005C52C56|nr:MobF family relaxase [Novosphingobium sp. P6W]AXB80617.1 conjugative relaxase [Novosphingobium sp. P6W]
MVASVAALKSAAQAASYYEADDYYADGESPSAWFGEAAKALGLSGEVERATFAAALKGDLPNGQQIGTVRGGEREHRPGWDMTFSAPKSVSIMAEVAGDRRLVDAHDRAVKVALRFVERHGAATRIREQGEIRTVETGKLAVATFRHNTSRAQDPQLHTHSVILNATQDKSGSWRSVESLAFFRIYKDAGAVYRQALAHEARQLGYGIREGKGSTFELAGVPEAVIRKFSARGNQVEAALAERGKTRADATAAEKAIITLATREVKKDITREALVPSWREAAALAGFGESERRELLAATQTRAATIRTPSLADIGRAEAAATIAVASAARHLSEREAVFGAAALEAAAGEHAGSRATAAQIAAAVTKAKVAGELIGREMRCGARAFTTREAMTTERRMLALEQAGRGQVTAPLGRHDAVRAVTTAAFFTEARGHKWTSGQFAAATGLLLGEDRVAGVQGYAGTAKTTTVLATYAQGMRAAGYMVRAFAPTAAAAKLLGDAIAAKGETVAKAVLTGEGMVTEARRGKEAWIVDEASMVSARDMKRMLDLADRAGARLVLVGDVKQLGSVEAGRAFGQLQDAGMKTFVLDKIVRQENDLTREAVQATIVGDGRRALEALDRGGGKVTELAEAGDRRAAMARDYAALSPRERERTLVMDATREGRELLTQAIRAELRKEGALGKDSVIVSTLESKGLTREEARHARGYEAGDVVTFRRDYERHGIDKGQAYRVESVDRDRNRIVLLGRDDRAISWQLDKWGRGQVESYSEVEREFSAGDRLQFTRNDRAAERINGNTATVTNIDAETRTMTIVDASGSEGRLSLDETRDRHVRHGWVGTIHGSQGATADRSMTHLESFRANTVDARSAYVAISRARQHAAVYTDSKAKLGGALESRTGERPMALTEYQTGGDREPPGKHSYSGGL